MHTSSSPRIREIPYNYTSYSDREIVIRFLGEDMWEIVNQLRQSRQTGLSARMLFEILGDMWVVNRNPYIADDLLSNSTRRKSLIDALYHRLNQVKERINHNKLAEQLMQATCKAVEKFDQDLHKQKALREKVARGLRKVTAEVNIDFGGLARVSHATDATDWRVELPFVVITPDTEQELADVVAACIKLKLTIIPRGGGTGYTGGAIPLHCHTAIINTEKLERLSEPEKITPPGTDQEIYSIDCAAGVVTRRVTEMAGQHQLVFAVDPTSQDASTIGGNIAMNAGGKKAVVWGTALDNLLSWTMVTPDANWMTVERINHNFGKIHDQELVQFRIQRQHRSSKEPLGEPETISMPGSVFRKQGLGKDVTDKYLSGLPGIQKEGCDGLIVSGRFILHRMPGQIRTVCLEFFGDDLSQAVPAVVEIKQYLDDLPNVCLTGLEHLDHRYIKAVQYATKAARPGLPKMVLLVDLSSEQAELADEAAKHIVGLAKKRQGEGAIAISADARRRFWLDRSRTAAISSHTNAFKINEDVVIPLPRLAEYSTAIERINIEQSLQNKLEICTAVHDYLKQGVQTRHLDEDTLDDEESKQLLQEKFSAACQLIEGIITRWQCYLDKLDSSAHALETSDKLFISDAEHNDRIIDLILRHHLRISYRRDVAEPLNELFSGKHLAELRADLQQIHAEIRKNRLFVALHMHAGDGNVHTNIPVHSNNYRMLGEANKIVDRIMQLAVDLGGVASGEHGIGLTKIQYLEAEKLQAFVDYKQSVDPEGHFNKGKLMPGSGLDQAYTPSLALLEQEAILMEESELGALNDDIKHCLRCGKCKPVCMTHIPRANLLYSPRNKILATGLIIEAFLYEEQTRRGISAQHFDQMNDVADHCTTCHKCFSPCPVNIDFGDVSMRMRKILVQQRKKPGSIGAKAAMAFLNMKQPSLINFTRLALGVGGFKAVNIAHSLLKKTGVLEKENRIPPPTTGKTPPVKQNLNLMRSSIRVELPSRATRAWLGIEDADKVPLIHNPALDETQSEAVFYFPGCGSERLISQISLATIAMLYETGAITVLPPGYLCCGFPQTAAGLADKGHQITTENRVLFHRVANTLNYLDIKTVIVSCGTCMDQLLKYEFERIFPGCRLLDIHEYLLEKGMQSNGIEGRQYIYHDPCHSPIKQHSPKKLAGNLLGQEVELSDRCCGEAGTLGTARPDIAEQLRFKKTGELQKNLRKLTGKSKTEQQQVKLLTSCPACQQGLSRYTDTTGLKTDYIVVEMAEARFGKNWQQQFVKNLPEQAIRKILL